MEELIFLLGEPLAKGSASQGDRAESTIREARSVSPIADFLRLCVPAGSSGRTSPECSAPMAERIFGRSSGKLMKSGILAHGECLTLNMCEWTVSLVPYLREDGVCSLSDILETGDIPPRYYLSPDACRGDTPPRRIKGVGVARSLTASTGGSSGKEQPTFISGDGRPLNALGVNGLVMDTVFWNGEDVSTTLTEAFADDRMPDKGKLPCVICRAGFSGGQDAKAGTGGGNLPLVQECFPATAVRRLLPIETERLMGFPDNHTRVPWRGKPEEKCPDGPRYKACGNSMCVNVMRWIGMRIENVEKTKGSQK